MDPSALLVDRQQRSSAPVSDTSSLTERFLRLQEQVLRKRPVLREILTKHGGKTLLDYANEYVDVNLNPPIVRRQHECLETIHEAASERFGLSIADGLRAQLEKYYFVSTADHTGPVTHPFFVNSNVLTALALHTHTDPLLRYVPVLACTNISLNNSSFPRGLLFNTCRDGALRQHRLSFLPSNAHACSAYNFRPFTKEEIVKVQRRLQEMMQQGDVSREIADRLHMLIEEVYDRSEILACESYRDQVARTNRDLWSRFFAASDVQVPQLLYLDQEDIVVRLLTKYHLTHDTVINHLLFDPARTPFIEQYFEGIFGSFSRADQAGTYLFWALPEGAKLNQQLWRKGRYLETRDGSYRVELSPEALREAMLKRELIPGLLLNFITICFYYGLKCLGGFNQVNYLTAMKNAYIKMNVDLGNYRSIEVCARAQTKEICDGLTFAFLGYDGGRVALASGIDLILYGKSDTWERLMQLSRQITIGEAMHPLMPEIYRISYDEKEWEHDIVSLTEKQVSELTGLDRKVRPCIQIADL